MVVPSPQGNFVKIKSHWLWWQRPVIITLGKPGQANLKFKASPGNCIVSYLGCFCVNIPSKNNSRKGEFGSQYDNMVYQDREVTVARA